MLTEAQKDFFRDNGYLAPLVAIDSAGAAEIRRRLEAFEAETGRSAGDSLHMKSHLYLAFLWELVQRPEIASAVADLLGPDVLILASRLWIKEPGDGKFVSWHYDTAYFGLDCEDFITVWIALTEASGANGAMHFLPGSHTVPPPAHEETHDPDNLLSRGQAVPGVDDSRAVEIVLRPGEYSIHHGRLLHASPPNESADRRIGLALMMMPTRVRSTAGRRAATLYLGRDRYNHWDHDPLPTRDRDPAIARLMETANAHYRDPARNSD